MSIMTCSMMILNETLSRSRGAALFSSRIILDEPEIFCKFDTSKLFNAFLQQPKSSDETLSIMIFRLTRLAVNTFSLNILES
jgi:hypothetical protein